MEKNKIIKRILQGTVISDKMDKTIVVLVERIKQHPRYKKRYKVRKKYKAHDPENKYKVGDKVQIQESKPISKDKKIEKIKKCVEGGLNTKSILKQKLKKPIFPDGSMRSTVATAKIY